MALRLATLCASLVAGASACVSHTAHRGESRPFDAPVTLTVTNDHWTDMVLYTVRGGTRLRLGTVRSMETRRFRIEHDRMEPGNSVRLLADELGSDDVFLTNGIVVNPGDNVALHLTQNLRFSSYAIDRMGPVPVLGAPPP